MVTAVQRALLSLASSMPDTLDDARRHQLANIERWSRRRLELILDGEPRLCAERQAEREVFGCVTE